MAKKAGRTPQEAPVRLRTSDKQAVEGLAKEQGRDFADVLSDSIQAGVNAIRSTPKDKLLADKLAALIRKESGK